MKPNDAKLEIRTLGCFSIFINGKSFELDWPDEALKCFLGSLLSPLDLYFSWDRMCRAMLNEPVTRAGKNRLEELYIRPLNRFLIKSLGFNPVIKGNDGIRIDKQLVYLDALEFHAVAVEGLKLKFIGNQAAALEKFNEANSLYGGSFLPGMSGKIILNTRKELESLHQAVAIKADLLNGNQAC